MSFLRNNSSFLLLGFIFLVAFNLRGPVTGLAPLIGQIESSFSLNSSQSGLITTLPLLSFAIFAPVAAWLARRAGMEYALLIGLVTILLGMLLRSLGSLPLLYIGATLVGAGIAVSNVLLPGILKREFPEHIIQLTALYVLMMSFGGALVSSSAIPLFNLFSGWSQALLCQALFVLPTLFVWWLIPKSSAQQQANLKSTADTPIWRLPVAWLVTSFLAFASLLNYVVVTWLPSILTAYGYSESTAGLYHGYMQLAGALPSLILAPFLARFNNRLTLCLMATAGTLISLIGLVFMPQSAVFWGILFGCCNSMGFILGLSFISIKTDTPQQAASLSGMAQLVGYALAAIGPVAIGALHDWLNQWQWPLLLLALLAVVWSLVGFFISRPQQDSPSL